MKGEIMDRKSQFFARIMKDMTMQKSDIENWSVSWFSRRMQKSDDSNFTQKDFLMTFP